MLIQLGEDRWMTGHKVCLLNRMLIEYASVKSLATDKPHNISKLQNHSPLPLDYKIHNQKFNRIGSKIVSLGSVGFEPLTVYNPVFLGFVEVLSALT